jgi:PPOX class probable F420-dependent enzyme
LSRPQSPFDETARRLLDEPNFAHVATLMRDGSPHVVPVWIARDGERLVFVKLEPSVGLRNLERDPRISISIVDRANPYTSVRARGRVIATERGELAIHWLHELAHRYTGAGHPEPLPNVALVIVEPTRVSSRQEEGYS